MSAAYDTSKHTIIGRTKTASEDYAKDGLRINAICPGYTATPLTMGAQYPWLGRVRRRFNADIVPMRWLALAQGLLMALFFSLAVVVLLLRVFRSL